MTPREQLDRIEEAKVALLLVLRNLDTGSTDCDSCGHMRYDSWNHKQAHDAINGAITRLEKAQSLITDAARTPEFWDRVKEKLKNGATSAQEEPTS